MDPATDPPPWQRPDLLAQREVLLPLVRDVLGCTCPDEVFERIRATPAPPGLPPGTLVEIGGRLLVLLTGEGPQRLAGDLAAIFARAQALRDARGCNRFRLVVALDAADGGQALQDAFEALGQVDDRLHLHRLPAAGLCRLLAGASADQR